MHIYFVYQDMWAPFTAVNGGAIQIRKIRENRKRVAVFCTFKIVGGPDGGGVVVVTLK